MIKPFLKEKTRARIKLHGGNLSTLHDCVARDILPAELGGEGPSFNPLDWVHQLLESSQITACDKSKSYHFTQSTIYSQPPPEYSKYEPNNNNNLPTKLSNNNAYKSESSLIEQQDNAVVHEKKNNNNSSFISSFSSRNGKGLKKAGDPARNSLLNDDL